MRLIAYPSPNSSNEEIFNESAPFYKDKPQQSGDQRKSKYNPVNTKIHNKCNHKTNIIWFTIVNNHKKNILEKKLHQLAIFKIWKVAR